MDTATAATSVALLDTETGAVAEARDDPAAGGRPGHAQKLLTLCRQVLAEADLRWQDLDRLAVGVGPGTFTGLRIGIATAHALSRSTGAELVGVCTLTSLALGTSLKPPTVLAVIDARRGEAFVGSGVLAPAVVKPQALNAFLTPGMIAVGDGAIKFRQVLQEAGAIVPLDNSPQHVVNAAYHCQIAATVTPGPLAEVQPQYLRVPDAELTHGNAKNAD